jgi:small subunit ribosomal protein S6
MRAYELMVIIHGDLDEGPAQAWTTQIANQVTQLGGQVVGKVDWWGKRRFAYEIAHRWEGYYAVMNIAAPAGALDELERSLRIADDIVRHKLLRLPDREAARRGFPSAA